jgi:hypothetical protein
MFNVACKSFIIRINGPSDFSVHVTDTLLDLENELLVLEDESVETGRVKLSDLFFQPNKETFISI